MNVQSQGEATVAVTRDVTGQVEVVRRRRVDFALVIGIDHYASRPLNGAVNDAEQFRAWLRSASGGRLKDKRIKVILSDSSGAPSQRQIDDALGEILRDAKALGGARRLYFYFAGHGMASWEHGTDVALLLALSSNSLERIALSLDQYFNALHGAGLFEEVAIFADCCRNRPFRLIPLQPGFDAECQALVTTSNFIAHATRAGQLAFETWELNRWHGIFTRCLLAIFDWTSSEGIAAMHLKDLLERKVMRRAASYNLVQRPNVLNALPGVSRFGRAGRHWLIRRLPFIIDAPRLELKFAERRGRVVLRGGKPQRDGKLSIVARHTASEKPWRLRLPLGLYLVEGGGVDPVPFWHNGQEEPHDV